jgi:hypothetical protein
MKSIYFEEVLMQWLAHCPSDELAGLLHRFTVELATRDQVDARNYVARAVAVLQTTYPHVQPATSPVDPPAA